MKKKSLSQFCSEIQKNLEDFEMDMEKAKMTAYRNDAQWLKMLSDYLGITDLQKDDDLNENDDLEESA